MPRKRRATGFDFSQPFESVLREVFRRAERGAGAEARSFFDWVRSEIEHPTPARDPDSPYQVACRVLGVDVDAPRVIIEAVYRTWAKLSHPDHTRGPAEEKAATEQMAEVNAAVAAIRKARGWK